ncbi:MULTISPECIES: LysE family translocator [unclassified Exiguobacterium]|uniref:LysE family translocator n=1 Tax=unclassified Exiguobacterium TaxID=2644629 RepID=UPI000EE54FE4|nr:MULTISPECIES: LysE family transporter [unclassified Exiguobacterium]HAK99493.1 lysine transporter LysE [Exiguobacterium sp.]HCV52486.1 lysine transporter LysE [Exiguobacterium sp.]
MFTTGFGIGFALAAPVGPIGLLCMQRTLRHGRISGIVSGLGAATADFTYGLLALSGFSLVQSLLTQASWMQLIGSLFLCYIGWSMFQASSTASISDTASSRLSSYLSVLLLTFLNPMTITLFLALFARFELTMTSGQDAVLFLIGIFLGSATWGSILANITHLLKHQVATSVLRVVQ